MRTHARCRHDVSQATIRALSPFFRYSTSRDAYVLRGIGNRFGPVLRVRRMTVDERPAPETA